MTTQQTERDALRKLANTLARYASGSSDYQAATTPAKIIDLLDTIEAQSQQIVELSGCDSRNLELIAENQTIRAELDRMITLSRGQHNRKQHREKTNINPNLNLQSLSLLNSC